MANLSQKHFPKWQCDCTAIDSTDIAAKAESRFIRLLRDGDVRRRLLTAASLMGVMLKKAENSSHFACGEMARQDFDCGY